MKEGKCFHCQTPGHLAQDCAAKAAISELEELEQREAPADQEKLKKD